MDALRQGIFLPRFVNQQRLHNVVIIITDCDNGVPIIKIGTHVVRIILRRNYHFARIAADIAPLPVFICHGNQSAIRAPDSHLPPLQAAVNTALHIKEAVHPFCAEFGFPFNQPNARFASAVIEAIIPTVHIYVLIQQQHNFAVTVREPLPVALLNPRIIAPEVARIIEFRRNHPIPRLVDMPPQAVVAFRGI